MNLGDDAVRRFRDFLGEPETAERGDRIGRFLLRREVARGGMGIVYEAEDVRLKRRVALKVLKEGDAGPDELARQQREAAIAAQLRHPNIVPVHEIGTAPDSTGRSIHFIAMDFIEGRTFADAIRDPNVPRGERLRMLEDVARAVAYAHGQGVVHRDLKPANVLVDGEGRVHLTDFGLARSESFATRLTAAHTVMGTPQYMAPEQVAGRLDQVDVRTDVYALGIILYEALTGKTPFVSAVPAVLYEEILRREPARPRAQDRSIPRDLEIVCLTAIDKDRERRFSSATDFADDLARIRRGEAIRARPPSLLYRWRKRLARRKALVALSLASLLVVGAIVAYERRNQRRARADSLRQLHRRMDDTLAAALALRRAGRLAEMRQFCGKTEEACLEAIREFPDRPEPRYERGRVLRALMRDDEALVEQDRALRLSPRFGPALYERIVLTVRRYRRRVAELVQDYWREGNRREIPSRRVLASRDTEASSDFARLEQDLRDLGGIGDERTDCARGLRTWIAGDSEKAREFLSSALAADPALEEAYEALATLELEQRRFEESVRWWTKGIESDLGYLPHLEGRVRTLLEWGASSGSGEHFEKAVADGVALVDKDPSRPAAWHLRGVARFTAAVPSGEERLFRDAVEDFGEAIRRSPSWDEAWMGRGLANLNWGALRQSKGEDPLGSYSLAFHDLGRAQECRPDRDGPWAARGLVRLNRGVWSDTPMEFLLALFDLDQALARNPGRDRTWLTRAMAERKLGRWLEERGGNPRERYLRAIADCGEALRRHAARGETWELRGSVRMDLAESLSDPVPQFSLAVSDFTEAIRRGCPARLKRADALATWASTAGEMDLWRRAVEDYDAWQPQSEVKLRRGRALTKWGMLIQGRGGDPSPHYGRAIEDLAAGPDQDEVWADRGFVRLNWGVYSARRRVDPSALFAEAVQAYGRAVHLAPERSAHRVYRGRTFEEWGTWKHPNGSAEFRAALADYRQAIRIRADLEPELREAMERCRKQAGE